MLSILMFSVYDHGNQWTLDYESNSVTLNGKDLVQNNKINPQEILEILMASSSQFLVQTQEFLNNHLARIPFTPN